MDLNKLATTIAYVTSIPLNRAFNMRAPDAQNEEFQGLAKYLPWAGYVISAILAVEAFLLFQIVREPLLIGTLLTISWLCITGGIHMDGLMDSADGIFSHQSKERMLEIMQDPRVGNFGVLAGIVVFTLKLVALTCLSKNPAVLIPVLIVVPIASRWSELYAIAKFEYAKENGTGKVWHETSKYPQDLFWGFIPLLLAASVLAYFFSYEIVLAATLFTLIAGIASAFRLNCILSGHTGDTYGAVVEISESVSLTSTALILAWLF